MLSEFLSLMPLLLASFSRPDRRYILLGSDYDFNSWLPLPVTMATPSFMSRRVQSVSVLHRHKDTLVQYKKYWIFTDMKLKLLISDECAFDCGTDCMCLWFSCSPSVAWCSVRVDSALSSLSGAVGGPVWLNGQSMKPLLAGFLILKMYLLVVLQGTLKASTKAAEDLCHAFILHRYCRQFSFKFCVVGPKISFFFFFIFHIFFYQAASFEAVAKLQ